MLDAPLRRRVLPAAALGVAAAVLATIAVSLPPLSRLGPLSIDTLFVLHRALTPPPARPAPSAVAIVALDEETYRRPPFADTPSALWTPELAQVLNAVLAAGAIQIGMDAIFPTSGARISPAFDRPFLDALAKAASQHKIVLGKVQHSAKPILPHIGQQIAIGRGLNIHGVNLITDADGVVRRVPAYFIGADGARESSFAAELALRARASAPDGDRRRPDDGTPPTGVLLNFAARGAQPLVYSLVDMSACAAAGRTDYFREHFAGRTVLIGAVLDVEDRRLTSLRYATRPGDIPAAPRCVYPPMTDLSSMAARDTIPGVLVLATAIDNLLAGTALWQFGGPATPAIVAALALVAAVVILALPLGFGIAAAAAALVLFTGGALAAFAEAYLVLPLLPGVFAAGVAAGMAGLYRYAVAGREARYVRRTFEFFLPPSVVAGLLSSGRLPALGGEEREISILFVDLAGFTARAEMLAAQDTVDLLNSYFSSIAEEIERHGGIVDKFIGDAALALFGVPARLPNSAAAAVAAALACVERLNGLNARHPLLQNSPLRQRIGINTGSAVVGNIGSRRRLNYTAIGDAVNLAQRVQDANRNFGTTILASEATLSRAREYFAWREVATVNVKGRTQTVTLYEPSPSSQASEGRW